VIVQQITIKYLIVVLISLTKKVDKSFQNTCIEGGGRAGGCRGTVLRLSLFGNNKIKVILFV
jgi:hypothetical protein